MPDDSARPNILLITTDQQRGDCLGIDENSPPALQTPNLDELARGGARFRRGYTECPSCFPARRCLMSGMAPAAQGMVGMSGRDWDPPHTLAGALRDSGYQTQLVGKLHLQPRGKRFGFEHQVLSDAPLQYDDAYARWLRDVHGRREVDAVCSHGQDPNGWVARPTHLPDEQTHTYWCVSSAIEFLEHHRDPTAPFFLNVSIFDPHPPIAPPRFYYDRYLHLDLPDPVIGDWADDWDGPQKGLRTDAWRINLDREQMRCCRAGYYGTVNFVDDQVGRLLQFLRRNRLMHNTFILFTSDHGEMLGDHHLYRKCWPYEASARVPFVIRAAETMQCPREVVSDRPVGLQDVLPTLLDAAGVPIPGACTGRSLLPIVRGEQAPVREFLHGEHAGQYEYRDGMHYLVDARHKYVWYTQRACEHLFDLVEDPHETHDLAREPDAEARLDPWRERMVGILKDRPEGFVQDGRLTLGRTHHCFFEGYEPDRFYPYL